MGVFSKARKMSHRSHIMHSPSLPSSGSQKSLSHSRPVSRSQSRSPGNRPRRQQRSKRALSASSPVRSDNFSRSPSQERTSHETGNYHYEHISDLEISRKSSKVLPSQCCKFRVKLNFDLFIRLLLRD